MGPPEEGGEMGERMSRVTEGEEMRWTTVRTAAEATRWSWSGSPWKMLSPGEEKEETSLALCSVVRV